MATKLVKLSELKVADLKRELEERELDTSGTKTVLQQRLREAVIVDGDDPDSAIFETSCGSSDLGKMLEKLEGNFENLEHKLQENSKSLEDKLEENSNSLK